MALTRDFRATVRARAERDPAFRVGLLEEALNALLDDDVETGKILLRDYVNATLGFEVLASEMDKSPNPDYSPGVWFMGGGGGIML